ncbi:arabinose-5-phosphate isomerase [Hansschlegelia beijingensis]|uniref:Arabinose-5-phosphate isomerase n=2 Tax=Hansschlegelia beijingensis TaxID=1133344 RepID=A0A7W6D3W2_9HYPH|nr:KpsF/GutQ family sugar-phosphate isomerase [Hansschlegelia beijingensis]MBB3972703.1 arabinose-5-phosphate isomerase [Hansschlegelia beijingensis]
MDMAVQQPLSARAPGRTFAASVDSALRTVDVEVAGVARLRKSLEGALGRSFAEAVDLIGDAPGRTIVTGMGKSGHIARKIAATLASTGTPAFFVHPAEASHGDLGMITTKDVVLALSWSGETAELRDLVNYAGRFRVPLVAITSNGRSALGKAANVALVLPAVSEACPHGLAPTTSTLMQLALGDALSVALLERRRFTPLEFKRFHPGGRLGGVLTLVRDVMRSGEAAPVVRSGAGMAEALIMMSAKSLGCVAVTDASGGLIGVITDGDLRRHMGPRLTDMTVDAVMTRAPQTISGEELAATALSEMQANVISALFVVDQGSEIGVVHMHDLIKLGVA